MAEAMTTLEAGDRFCTLAQDGRAYLWSVADNGNVLGRVNHELDRRVGVYEYAVIDLRDEHDALAATVQRVRNLCDEARFYVDSHEDGPGLPPTARLVPVADLRAALAPSDPATGSGGEGHG